MEQIAEHLSEGVGRRRHTHSLYASSITESSLPKETIFPSLLATQSSLSLSYKIKVVLICMVHKTLCDLTPYQLHLCCFFLELCAQVTHRPEQTVVTSLWFLYSLFPLLRLSFFVVWQIPVYLSKCSWVPLPLGNFHWKPHPLPREPSSHLAKYC